MPTLSSRITITLLLVSLTDSTVHAGNKNKRKTATMGTDSDDSQTAGMARMNAQLQNQQSMTSSSESDISSTQSQQTNSDSGQPGSTSTTGIVGKERQSVFTTGSSTGRSLHVEGKGQRTMSNGGESDMGVDYDSDDYDFYAHGVEHGLVETTIRLTTKEWEKKKKTESSGDPPRDLSLIPTILDHFEAQNAEKRAGQALGPEKGNVLEQSTRQRYLEFIEKSVIKKSTSSDPNQNNLNQETSESETSELQSDHTSDKRKTFNILELGAHLGDGTLRVLNPIVQEIVKEIMSKQAYKERLIQKSKNKESSSEVQSSEYNLNKLSSGNEDFYIPQKIHIISAEHNQKYLVEGKKLLSFAVKSLETQIPEERFIPFKLLHRRKRALEKIDSTGTSTSSDSLPLPSISSLINYQAVMWDEDESFSVILQSLMEQHDIEANEGFDIVILDHKPSKFKTDLEYMIEHKALNYGCIVIADNIGRNSWQLSDYKKYVGDSSSGEPISLNQGHKASGSGVFTTEKFVVSNPYPDIVYVSKYHGERAGIGKKRRPGDSHDDLETNLRPEHHHEL